MALFNKKKKNTEEEAIAKNATTTPSPDEQMMRRQSAPRPTPQSEAQRLYQMQQAQMISGQGMDASGAMDGFKALTQVIGKEQIQKANLTLNRYKEGKANLEQKIVDNEQWYKQRHWEQMRDKKEDIQPSSAWLFNSIANKHADAMDNFPSPNILPREDVLIYKAYKEALVMLDIKWICSFNFFKTIKIFIHDTSLQNRYSESFQTIPA